MRLLVTGGAGFIGSSFIEAVLSGKPDATIVNVDNLTYASIFKSDFEKRFLSRYKFVKSDILDGAMMARLCKDTDIVVNFAAETHVDNSIGRPLSFVQANVLGTATLLDAALKAGHGRFVQISTDEVYGSAEKHFFKETDPFAPSSPYSASKAGAEMMVAAYEKTYGIKATITRSSNNYGPRQHPEKFIPRAITRLLAGKKVPIYGKGSNVRNWIHASDNCDAIWLLLEKRQDGAYNIASDTSISNLELARAIARIMKKGEGALEFVEDRKGHDFRYAIDASKIKALGWKPKIDFAKGLEATVEWYVKNRKEWAGHIV